MAEHPICQLLYLSVEFFFFCYMDATFNVYVSVYALACIDAFVSVARLQSFVCLYVSVSCMNALRTPYKRASVVVVFFFLLSSSFSSRIFNEIDFLEYFLGGQSSLLETQ